MKKLLAWLASVTLVGSLSTTLVSCFSGSVSTGGTDIDESTLLHLSSASAEFKIDNENSNIEDYTWSNTSSDDLIKLQGSPRYVIGDLTGQTELDKEFAEKYLKIVYSEDKQSFKVQINSEQARHLNLKDLSIPTSNTDSDGNLIINLKVNTKLKSQRGSKLVFEVKIQGISKHNIEDLKPEVDPSNPGTNPGGDGVTPPDLVNPPTEGNGSDSHGHDDPNNPGKVSLATYLGALKNVNKSATTRVADENTYYVDSLSTNREYLAQSIMNKFVEFNGETIKLSDGSKVKIKELFKVDQESIILDSENNVESASLVATDQYKDEFSGKLNVAFVLLKAKIKDHITDLKESMTLSNISTLSKDKDFYKELLEELNQGKLINFVSDNSEELANKLKDTFSSNDQSLEDIIKHSASSENIFKSTSEITTNSDIIDSNKDNNKFDVNYNIQKANFSDLFKNFNSSSDPELISTDSKTGMQVNPGAVTGVPDKEVLTWGSWGNGEDANVKLVTEQLTKQLQYLLVNRNTDLNINPDMFEIKQSDVKVDMKEDNSAVKLSHINNRGSEASESDEDSVLYGDFKISVKDEYKNLFNDADFSKEIPFYLSHTSIKDEIINHPGGNGKWDEKDPNGNTIIPAEAIDKEFLSEKTGVEKAIIEAIKKNWPTLAGVNINLSTDAWSKVNTGEPSTWIGAVAFATGSVGGNESFSFRLQKTTINKLFEEKGIQSDFDLSEKYALDNKENVQSEIMTKLQEVAPEIVNVNGTYDKENVKENELRVGISNTTDGGDFDYDQLDQTTWKYGLKANGVYAEYLNNEKGLSFDKGEFNLASSTLAEIFGLTESEVSIKLKTLTISEDLGKTELKNILFGKETTSDVFENISITGNPLAERIIKDVKNVTNPNYVSGDWEFELNDEGTVGETIKSHITGNLKISTRLTQINIDEDFAKAIAERAELAIPFDKLNDLEFVKEKIYEAIDYRYAKVKNYDSNFKDQLRKELKVEVSKIVTFSTEPLLKFTISSGNDSSLDASETLFTGTASSDLGITTAEIGNVIPENTNYELTTFDFWSKLNDKDNVNLKDSILTAISKQLNLEKDEFKLDSISYENDEDHSSMKGTAVVSGANTDHITGNVSIKFQIASTTWNKVFENQELAIKNVSINSPLEKVQTETKNAINELAKTSNNDAYSLLNDMAAISWDKANVANDHKGTVTIASNDKFKANITGNYNVDIDLSSEDSKAELSDIIKDIDLGSIGTNIDRTSDFETIKNELNEMLKQYIIDNNLATEDPELINNITVEYTEEQYEADLKNATSEDAKLSGVKIVATESGKSFYKGEGNAEFSINKATIKNELLVATPDPIDIKDMMVNGTNTLNDYADKLVQQIYSNNPNLTDGLEVTNKEYDKENNVVKISLKVKDSSTKYKGENTITVSLNKSYVSDIFEGIALDLTKNESLNITSSKEDIIKEINNQIKETVKAKYGDQADSIILNTDNIFKISEDDVDLLNQSVTIWSNNDALLIGSANVSITMNKLDVNTLNLKENITVNKDNTENDVLDKIATYISTITNGDLDNQDIIQYLSFEKDSFKVDGDKWSGNLVITDNLWLKSETINL